MRKEGRRKDFFTSIALGIGFCFDIPINFMLARSLILICLFCHGIIMLFPLLFPKFPLVLVPLLLLDFKGVWGVFGERALLLLLLVVLKLVLGVTGEETETEITGRD